MADLILAALLSAAPLAPAPPFRQAPPSADQLAFFESRIRPVLVDSCYECHSHHAGRLRGGLAVDSRAGLAAGGDTGPAVVPGNLEESLLWEAVSYAGYEMPPDGPLPDAQIEDLRAWILMGAPDPRVPEVEPVRHRVSAEDIEAARDFWSFRAPERGPAPEVDDERWVRSEVDRYVLAQLEARDLRPTVTPGRPSCCGASPST